MIIKKNSSWGGILLEPYPELLTTWYAERLIDGSIPASKENILAAKRHLLDLKRQGTEEFPWIFDEEVGHRPIRFIEDNCRPTEGDLDHLFCNHGNILSSVRCSDGFIKTQESDVFVKL